MSFPFFLKKILNSIGIKGMVFVFVQKHFFNINISVSQNTISS